MLFAQALSERGTMVAPAVESALRTGRGVRRDDLAERLPTELARRMHVDLTAAAEVVLATVAWQVAGLIARTFRQPRDRVLLTGAYNLRRDPDLTSLLLKDRVVVLSGRMGLSVSRLNSLMSELTKRTCPAFDAPFPVPDLREIDREAAAEAEYARREPTGEDTEPRLAVAAESLTRAVTRALTGEDGRGLARLALDGVLHVEAVPGEGLVTTRAGDGEYLCAFTEVALLRAHRVAARSPVGSRELPVPGRELVAALAERGGIGLVLNPPADGTRTGELRTWIAAELAQLKTEVCGD
ncbi:hypothetical protein [Actinokineospora inagensis]|uniref:hypothetical protein n=1 Tax=Actinokineospora inagensis TaxID=103730 RepID=UPI0003F8CD66|nr:hypothetical protein [Actinokineospora inagensis]